MFDAHTHILPGVDDGVASVEELPAVIDAFKQKSVDKIVLTPHFKMSYDDSANWESIYAQVKSMFDEAGIQTAMGAEFNWKKLVEIDLEDLHKYTLGNSNYILLELSFDSLPAAWDNMFKQIENQGLQIILAHPERYLAFANDFSLAKQIHKSGIMFMLSGQYVDKSWMAGFARKLGKKMLKAGLVDLVCSDAHGLGDIELYPQAIKFAGKYGYSVEKADEILSACF